MLAHRLVACGATLACATFPLVVPTSQAYALPHASSTTSSSSTALPASDATIELNAATASQALHEAHVSNALSHTRRSTSSTSDSRLTTFEALVLIVIITIIFLPASIVYVIFYRRARKDVRDMPNYTGTNGPQYGVTGFPQGTVPPSRSRYTGFNPLWSRNASFSGGPVAPGAPGTYGTNTPQVPPYGTPTGQGPVYGTQPAQGPGYGYGTQPGQAPAYGYGGQAPAYGYGTQGTQGQTYGTQGSGQGDGTAPSPQAQDQPFGPANGQAGGTTSGQNYPSY